MSRAASKNAPKDVPRQRIGLAKYRTLTESKKTPNDVVKSELPDGWFFNEQNVDQFWKNIEGGAKIPQSKNDNQKKMENEAMIKDTSALIWSLVNRFDEIDQETFIDMEEIAGDSGVTVSNGVDVILADTKCAVIDYINSVKEMAEGQDKLLSSIKSWLGSAKLPLEMPDEQKMPTTEQVFDQIASMIRDYSMKTERATCLHNDISEMWIRKISSIKRKMIEKDEEIRKMEKNIKAAKEKLQKERREKRKAEESSEMKQMKAQMEITLRQNEEMKKKILGMKNEMTQMIIPRMAEQINGDGVINGDINQLSLSYDLKTRVQLLEQEKQGDAEIIKKFETELKLKNDRINYLTNKLEQSKQTLKNLDENFRNHLDYLAKNHITTVIDNSDANISKEDDYYELKIEHQNEIKKLNNFYAQKLQEQSNGFIKKMNEERKKIYSEISNNGSEGTSKLLNSITEECERRVEGVEKAEREKRESLSVEFNRKLMTLTRQYERKLERAKKDKDIVEINMQNRLNYEIKKIEISYQSKLASENQEMEKKFKEIVEDSRKKISSYAEQLEKANEEITELKKKVITLDDLREMSDDEIEEKEEREKNLEKLQILNRGLRFVDTAQMNAKQIKEVCKYEYMAKIKELQSMMEEEKEWELLQQKKHYEKEMKARVDQKEKEIRKVIINLTQKINDNKDDDRLVLVSTISDSIAALNITDIDDKEEEEEIKNNEELDEAIKRARNLSQQVQNLSVELVGLKDIKKSYDDQSIICKALDKKNKILEKLTENKDADVKNVMKMVEEEMQKKINEENNENENVFYNFEIENFFVYEQEEKNPEEETKQEVKVEIKKKEKPKKNKEKEKEEKPKEIEKEVNKEEIEEEIRKLELGNLVEHHLVALEDKKKDEDDEEPEHKRVSGRGKELKIAKIGKEIEESGDVISSSRSYCSRKKRVLLRKPRNKDLESDEIKERVIEKPVEVIKYVEKPVEVIKYVEKPVEVIKYIEKPAENAKVQEKEVIKAEKTEEVAKDVKKPEEVVKAIEKIIGDAKVVMQDFGSQTVATKLDVKNESFTVEPTEKIPTKVVVKEAPKVVEKPTTVLKLSKENEIEIENVVKEPVKESVEKMKKLTFNKQNIFDVEEKQTVYSEKEETARMLEDILPKPSARKARPFQRPLTASTNGGNIRLVMDHFRQDMSKFHEQMMNKISSFVPEAKIVVIHDKSEEQEEFRINVPKNKVPTISLSQQKDKLGLPPQSLMESSNKIDIEPVNEQYERLVTTANREEEDYSEYDSETEDIINTINSENRSTRRSEGSIVSANTIMSNSALTFDFDDALYKSDPFAGAISLLGQSMRFLSEMKDNQDEAYEDMWSSVTAFDAYCSALGTQDDSLINFIQSLRERKTVFDEQQSSLFRLFNADEKLLKILRVLKMKYKQTSDRLKEVEAQQLSSQSSVKQNIINSLSEDTAHAKNADEITRVEIIHQLIKSLDLITNMNLANNKEDMKKLIDLKSEAESLLLNPEADKVESLSKRVKEFISSLKTGEVKSQRPIDNDDVEQMKRDLRRIRKMRDSYKKQIHEEKEKTADLEAKIQKMKCDLEEEREYANSNASLLKAQLDSLKELLGEDGKDDDDVLKRLKEHSLNMEALISTTASERNNWRDKYEEINEINMQNEEQIRKLQEEIKSLLLEARKNMKPVDFTELLAKEDEENEKAEEESEISKYQIQLEESLAQNKLLATRNNELEKVIIQTKSQLREAHDEIDDLQLKNAYRVKEIPASTNKHVAIQCRMIEPQVQQKVKEKPKPKPFLEDIRDYTIIEDELPRMIIKKDETPKEETNVKKDTVNTEDSHKSDDVPTLQKAENSEEKEVTKTGEDQQRMKLAGDGQLMSTTTFFELEKQQQQEEDDFYDDFASIEKDRDNTFLQDAAPYVVHSPLSWKKKKKPLVFLPSSTKTRNHRLSKQRSASVIAPTFPEEVDPTLTVNGAVQGTRQLKGTSCAIKPTQSLSSTTAMLYNTVTHPDKILPKVRVKPEVHISSTPSSLEATPVKQEIVGGMTTHPVDINVPPPTRITIFVNQNEIQHPKQSRLLQSFPIVDDIKQHAISKTCPQSPFVESLEIKSHAKKEIEKRKENQALNDAFRRINKLKEQKIEMSKQLDDKDNEIVQLKKKLSEITIILHREKLDAIKYKDMNRNTKIRYDDIKKRLDIAIQELGARDEENCRLKREINNMKMKTIPATSHNEKAERARKEEKRLASELKHKDAMKNATEKMLKGPKLNQSVKKHLENLLANTQRSIARINAQRKMWKERETQHTIDALSALSLIQMSDVEEVREMIPGYSPFKKSQRISSLISRIGLRQDSEYMRDLYEPSSRIKTRKEDAKKFKINVKSLSQEI